MLRVAVLVGALVFAAGGCAAPAAPHRPKPPTTPDRPPVIVDADAYGVVFMDSDGHRYVGVRRDGTVAWTAPAGPADPIVAGCLLRCPDAVLSGSADALNAPGTPDPAPVLVVDGQRQSLTVLAGPKRWVLTAAAGDDLIAHAGDGNGRWWLEIRHGGAATQVAVGGPRTSWREDPDGRHGLAVSTVAAVGGAPAAEARWFDRDDAGWRTSGPVTRVTGFAACVNPSGTQALLIGQRPVLLDRAGALTPVTDLDRVGTCALTDAGGIVVDLGRNGRGARSLMRVFDSAGTVTRREETATGMAVSADPTGPRVAYVADGALVEFDPRSGTRLRTLTDIRAARYDGAGGMVVLRGGTQIAWL